MSLSRDADRDQLLDTLTSSLTTEAALSTDEAADAVAATAMLEHLNSTAALQQFLQARRQWLQQQLTHATANGMCAQDAGLLLSKLAQSFLTCIAQVGNHHHHQQQQLWAATLESGLGQLFTVRCNHNTASILSASVGLQITAGMLQSYAPICQFCLQAVHLRRLWHVICWPAGPTMLSH